MGGVNGVRRKGNRLLAERPLPEDVGTPGRRRQVRPGRMAPARSVTVNLAESPLGWLHSRGLVNERQLAAGEMLRRDWELSQLPPAVTMRWDPARQSRGAARPAVLNPTEAQIAAKARFQAAVAAVGSGLSDILWRIVCAGDGMRDAESALGWPARAGRIVLAIALDRLADFYRLR